MTEDAEYKERKKEIFGLRMDKNTAAEKVRTKEKGRNRRMKKTETGEKS